MKEETTRCLNYGIYSPWSEYVNAILRASDEFSPVVAEQTSEPVFVAAGTSSSDALHSDLCFKMGDVYDENCLLGPLLCERTCPQERFEYAGQVIVEEAPRDAELRGTGSGTTFGVAAPLRLIVDCQNLQRDYTPLLFVGGIVGGVATAVAVKRHRSHGKKGRKKYHFVIKI
ncbi:MAG: hypothetical protein HYW25_05985 [Candidatus Aenigmarchaeota archaeon]|nr:hypothetical protein [Candidatus Aenigmarchaeota archaeon]